MAQQQNQTKLAHQIFTIQLHGVPRHVVKPATGAVGQHLLCVWPGFQLAIDMNQDTQLAGQRILTRLRAVTDTRNRSRNNRFICPSKGPADPTMSKNEIGLSLLRDLSVCVGHAGRCPNRA
jgi:hypothetical protein